MKVPSLFLHISASFSLILPISYSINVDNNHFKDVVRINTFNGPLEIRGRIRTIRDIKHHLSGIYSRGSPKLYSNCRQLADDEIYSEVEHPKILMCMETRGGMNISVETMTGKSIQVEVAENETILDVKRKLSEKQNIPLEQQRMIYNGKLLDDNKTLAEYNIKNNAVIQLVLRLRGGIVGRFLLYNQRG